MERRNYHNRKSYNPRNNAPMNSSGDSSTLGPRNNTAWKNNSQKNHSQKYHNNRNKRNYYHNSHYQVHGESGWYYPECVQNHVVTRPQKKPASEKLSAMSDEAFARLSQQITRWEKISLVSGIEVMRKICGKIWKFVKNNTHVEWDKYQNVSLWVNRLQQTTTPSPKRTEMINSYLSTLRVYNAILQTPLPSELVLKMVNCIMHMNEFLRLEYEISFINQQLGDDVIYLFKNEKAKRDENERIMREKQMKEEKEKYVIECIDYLLAHQPDVDISRWNDDRIIKEAHKIHYARMCCHQIDWKFEYKTNKFLDPTSFQEDPQNITRNMVDIDDENFDDVFLSCFDTVMDWAICTPSDAFQMKGLFDIHSTECLCQLEKINLRLLTWNL